MLRAEGVAGSDGAREALSDPALLWFEGAKVLWANAKRPPGGALLGCRKQAGSPVVRALQAEKVSHDGTERQLQPCKSYRHIERTFHSAGIAHRHPASHIGTLHRT